ncbi:tyrosine-type recombinase/integrase [Actinoplanes subtropicus]|uniref:tyrosine-type recombinase/integrase n=1 Tax=Actinoplanes subtropicus TaxID=543632 RepID=UPI0004C44BCD|nr:site-specific integrase [Actinoplanes subtropicus]
MATVKRSPNGKKWRVRWYDPDGNERAKDFDRSRDAKNYGADMEASKAKGRYVDLSSKTTVAEYARQWAEMRPHKESTAKRVESTIRNHVEGTRFGSMRLVSVRHSHAQAWATGRAAVLAPSTLRVVVYTVSAIFKAAIADQQHPGLSPFLNVALPEQPQARLVPLSVAQVRALADAVPDRCRAMVITQAGLGLRLGELLALTREDVDFLRRRANVQWQFRPGSRKRVRPKTKLSERPIPLPGFVADALALHMKEYPPLRDGSVFHNSRGGVWTHAAYGTKVLGDAVERAGLPEGTTSHDLRHHFASVLLAAGESVVAVAEWLGHANADLVVRVYGHLMPDSDQRMRQRMDAAWADADQVRTAGPLQAV